MATPKSKSKPKVTTKPDTWGAGSSEKELRSVGKGTSINDREAILKKFQEEISPKGVAAYEAAAMKALEQKYPGIFNTVPKTRTTPGVKGK